jgi:hypothetical protein
MKTLSDCVKEYEQASALRQAEQEIAEVKRRQAVEESTWKAFAELGLEPTRVNWQDAYFEYEGIEVHLVLAAWRYAQVAFYRVLEKCPNCENNLMTDESSLSLENIGWALSNPEKRYHDCEFVGHVESTNLDYEPTAREKFMDALDEYLRQQVS